MGGDNSRSEREAAPEVLVEKQISAVSENVAPGSARLNRRVIIEFAAMAVAIAAIAYLYFHH